MVSQHQSPIFLFDLAQQFPKPGKNWHFFRVKASQQFFPGVKPMVATKGRQFYSGLGKTSELFFRKLSSELYNNTVNKKRIDLVPLPGCVLWWWFSQFIRKCSVPAIQDSCVFFGRRCYIMKCLLMMITYFGCSCLCLSCYTEHIWKCRNGCAFRARCGQACIGHGRRRSTSLSPLRKDPEARRVASFVLRHLDRKRSEPFNEPFFFSF